STGNPEMLINSGGLVRDNLGVEYGALVFAIAESPLEEGVIWAGTNDGQVQLTRDGGGAWTNVTGNISGLPPHGTVSNIEPSRYDAGSAYISVDLHQVNNRRPFIYKTTDYGQSWERITNGIPESVFSYVHVVREDPTREGLLYAGTENGLYVSFNDGQEWQPLQTNLPHAPVHWLVVQEHFNDLVVGTYGRGFWILDDITPIQQLTQEIVDSDVHLFEPRSAYRFLMKAAPMEVHDDPSLGDNPPYGASIHYYLNSDPGGDVKITILDEQGGVVETFEGTGSAGINRVWWDLRHQTSKQARLRTPPLYAPWVEPGPEGWRPIVTWGVRGSGIRPLAAPGTYTVRMEVDGQVLTQPLVVRKDPSSTGTVDDIRQQVDMSLEIRDNLNDVVEMINEVEWIRKQIYDLNDRLEGEEQHETILEAGKELDEKLIDFEQNLFQMRLTGGGQDVFRNPSKLYARLGFLYADVETSWGGVGSDWPPTSQAIEVHGLLKERLRTYQGQFRALLSEDLTAFNGLLRENNLGGVVSGHLP
ncbi:WD40/YVTN/BNR-like repeat-containing protein, partial [Gemmatimonadota bacterium]